MIRDKLNSDIGYQENIEQINGFISKAVLKIKNLQLDELNGIQNHPKSNKAIINSTQWRLFNDYFDLLKINYSIGKPLEELPPIYLKALEYFTKSWKPQARYIQMIEMLSLGILFNINDTDFFKLINLIDSNKVKDKTLDLLIKYRKPDRPISNNILFPKLHTSVLNEIIDLSKENKEKALELLKKYLKKWYRSIEIKTHESKWNIHKGYWSWESGAIAKILNLDDNSLKNQQYYPYDMVHFEE